MPAPPRSCCPTATGGDREVAVEQARVAMKGTGKLGGQ
jgi:hypothetical protein